MGWLGSGLGWGCLRFWSIFEKFFVYHFGVYLVLLLEVEFFPLEASIDCSNPSFIDDFNRLKIEKKLIKISLKKKNFIKIEKKPKIQFY